MSCVKSNNLMYSIILIIITNCNVVNSDVFASIVDLKNTFKAERSVIQYIKDYVAEEAIRLKEITDMIEEMEERNAAALENPEQNLADMVVGFQTINRFTNIWGDQKARLLSTKNTDNLISRIESKTKNYPNDRDLKRAADSIFRIQDVYLFECRAFTNGSLAGYKYKMNAYDCYQVAWEAFNLSDFYHTILWLEEALRLATENKDDDSITRDEIYSTLITAYQATVKKENIPRMIELAKEWVEYNPQSKIAQKTMKYFDDKLQSEVERRQNEECNDDQCKIQIKNQIESYEAVNQKVRHHWEEHPDYIRFETLCRGEDVYTNKRLYCRYKRDNPIFAINPAREEVLRMDPFIAIYHDFLSDKETEKLKIIAEPSLHRSTTFGTENLEDKDTYIRTSKTAWVKDSADPLVRKVTHKSLALHSLSNETVEEMQIVCYGLGGHYGPHHDYNEATDFQGLGDRIATIVHYLSDFTGGSTAFMNVGVRVPPKKGTTLFWWNLKRNLKGDVRTLHAGCPVIYGNKWIANKWVHDKAQWDIRPCLPDENA